jgi:hypothetical protein
MLLYATFAQWTEVGSAPHRLSLVGTWQAGLTVITTGQKSLRDATLNTYYKQLEEVAQRIDAVAQPGQPIGAIDVGAVAYVTGAPVLDALGLNDAAIAHLPRTNDSESLWGNYHLDRVLDAAPPVIAIALPRQVKWSLSDVATGAATCGPLARDISYRMQWDLDAIEENYLCTSVYAADSDWVLNLLTHQTLYAPPKIPGLEILRSKCLRDFVAACPKR